MSQSKTRSEATITPLGSEGVRNKFDVGPDLISPVNGDNAMLINRLFQNRGYVIQKTMIGLLIVGLFSISLISSNAANRRNRQFSASTRIAAPQGETALPQCTIPGISLTTDASGDTGTGSVGTVPGTPAQDITEILVAEPNQGGGINRLAFTMKVADLTTLPPGGVWRVFFNVGATGYFVGAVNDAVSGVAYTYGTTGTTTTTVGNADSGSMSVANGTITVVVSNNKVGSPGVGSILTAIYGRTQTLIGTAGTGATPSHDLAPNSGTTSTVTYTLVGSAVCPSFATPTPTPTPTVTPTPAPGVAGPPRFFNYEPPTGLAEAAGEPSIGVNFNTEQSFSNSMFTIPNGGTTMYFGGFMTAALKVTFSDCSSPAAVTWDQKALRLPNAPRAFGDPILFTDHQLGRTFVCQLLGLTPAGSTVDITDDDGETLIPSEGSGLPSDIDHETIGGGPAHAPLDTAFNALPYKHPVYYASQSIGEARCARSDDGGVTFGPATLMYTVAQCSGLHGHIKVAPDGTVYIPDNGCGGADVLNHSDGQQAVIVSEDNGITWNIRPVPGSTTIGDDDSAVGVSVNNDPTTGKEVIYLGMQSGDGHPRVAVSKDKGVTWSAPFDVGANVVNGGPVVNTTFPAMVAGDYNRAAFAFFGTETAGGYADSNFPGVWYLYLATTFDGGQTWHTENITPNDPIQRGGICGGGLCRNLLDFFDITIDKEGRILVGGEDGCIGNCVDGPPNSFSAKALISRQTGGKRLLAQFDPVEPALPGAPLVNGIVNPSTVATLDWPTPDHGGSAITGYNVYRNTGSGFTLFASVQETNFMDPSYAAGTTYRVTAVNGQGEGPYCHDITPSAAPLPKACQLPGILTVNDILTDGQNNDFGANQPPDPSVNIRQLYVAEPFPGKLVFTINVGISPTGVPPPQSQWYIIWNKLTPNSTYDRNWVGMLTDQTGAITYQYGNFGVPLDPLGDPTNPNADKAVKVGDADSGSYNPATGEIRITVSNSKLENIQVGQSMSNILVRTFLAKEPTELKRVQTAADTTDPSHYGLVGNAACLQTVPLVSVVSRKTHTGVGPYDVNLLPATGLGIECRVGQGAGQDQHQVVFTFANPLVTVAGATVSGTKGSPAVAGSSGINPNEQHEYLLNLTGVQNEQKVTITLTGISDTVGNNTASLSVDMGVLLADTNEDRSVDGTDVSQTKAQSGKAASSEGSVFREDINLDGFVDGTDVSFVKSRSGSHISP